MATTTTLGKSLSLLRTPCCRPALHSTRKLTLVAQTPAAQNADLRVTFFCNKFNSLSQRVFVELSKRNHAVKVFEVDKDNEMDNKSIQEQSDIIICPFLTKRVPENVWRCKQPPCLIVHPGIEGDRGLYAIDWALEKQLPEWGVTVLQADQEMDMGDIWSTKNFPTTRPDISTVTKSSVYQNEVTEKALVGVLEAIDNFKNKRAARPLNYNDPAVKGVLHDRMLKKHRTVFWEKSAEEIANVVRMCDSQPGSIATIGGEQFRAFGAHVEKGSLSFRNAKPGDIVGHRHGAILAQTGDGLLWLSHLKKDKLKLPASAYTQNLLRDTPAIPAPSYELPYGTYPQTFQETWTTVSPEGVGYVYFNFYNGAMGTDQCKRLVGAIDTLKRDPRVKVVTFMGGHNYFSNGIHLNEIENSSDPAQASWENINGINDVVKAMFEMPKPTISAVNGNAGAGGAMMTMASDMVWAKKGAVMNPSYKSMNLYGSEYHSYFLPQRVGKVKAKELLAGSSPLHSSDALEFGMFDQVFGDGVADFRSLVEEQAKKVAVDNTPKPHKPPSYMKDLQQCRESELAQMAIDFQSEAYKVSRKAFVLH